MALGTRAPHPPPVPVPGGHLPALDGLRGLAILLVLLHHFFHPFFSPHALDAWLIRITRGGWCGVDLFFVLSGFLITGILLDAKRKRHYFRNFYVRRVLRIFPLYFAVLALYFVVFPLLPDPKFGAYVAGSVDDQAWFWTYMTNFRLAERLQWYPNVVPNVYWSLAVEEQFYLVWPFVVLVLRRAALARVCLLLLAGAFLLRVGMTLSGADPIATLVLTPARIDTLAAGAFLACLVRARGGLRAVRLPVRPLLAASGAGLAAIFLLDGGLRAAADVTRTIGFSLFAVFFASLLLSVLFAPEGSRRRRFFTQPALRTLGKYSYALYLLHGPIGSFLTDVVRPYEFPRVFGSMLPGMAVYTAACLAVSLAAAILSWNLLERHFLRLKRFFREEAPAAATGDAAGAAGMSAARAAGTAVIAAATGPVPGAARAAETDAPGAPGPAGKKRAVLRPESAV